MRPKHPRPVQFTARQTRRLSAALLLLLTGAAALAQSYNPADCAQVAGTLNIHWRAVNVPDYIPANCTGIESTDGTAAAAATGQLTLTGTGVNDWACIVPSQYHLTMAAGGAMLQGYDSPTNLPSNRFTWTRAPSQACFHGHWRADYEYDGVVYHYDYYAHLDASAFPPLVPVPVPTLPAPALGLLMAGVLALAARGQRRSG